MILDTLLEHAHIIFIGLLFGGAISFVFCHSFFDKNPLKYIPNNKEDQKFIIKQKENTDPSKTTNNNDYYIVIKYVVLGRSFSRTYYKKSQYDGIYTKYFKTPKEASDFVLLILKRKEKPIQFSKIVNLNQLN
jgi:hypothetical protein